MRIFLKLFITLLLSSILSGSFGQESKQNKQIVPIIFDGLIVKADILMPLIYSISNKSSHSSTYNYTTQMRYSITIEKQIKERNSIQLSGGFYMRNRLGDFNEHHRINTFEMRITPEYKFFILKNKPITGPYIGVYALMEFEEMEDIVFESEHYYYHNIKAGGGLSTGYQFYIKKRIVIDGSFGIGSKKMIDGHSLYHTDNYTSMDFRIALNIGYKF